MQISVILVLAEAGVGLAGTLDMVVTTGKEVLSWQKRTRKKLDLLLRMRERF